MTITTRGFDALAHLMEAEFEPGDAEEFRPRYNVAPTDAHPIVIQDASRKLVPARWGFGEPRLVINGRAETVRRFGATYRERRCLVPADGFYEWTGPRNKRRPIWFHPKSEAILRFAGLWIPRKDGIHFIVLTTKPNALVAPVHDRMPVILDKEKAAAWLERPLPPEELGPAPDEVLVATPVSSKVNSVKNDDPTCLEPPESSEKDAPEKPRKKRESKPSSTDQLRMF